MIFILFSVLQALYGELLGMFRDRLASEEHVQQFEAILKQTMRKYFGKEVRAANPTKNQVYTLCLLLSENLLCAQIAQVPRAIAWTDAR